MKSFLKHCVILVLTIEAKLVLKKYKPRVIAVTGSVGKTSAKDALFSVLSLYKNTRKSLKSFNSEIGVPLTVLDLPNEWNDSLGWIKNIVKGFLLLVTKKPYPELLVLEVGADHPHDIQNISAWLKPDIAVFTQMSKVPVHVEFFSSPAQVFEEKSFLFKNISLGGTMILNADDEDVLSLSTKISKAFITFGFSETAIVKASNIAIEYDGGKTTPHPTGMSVDITYKGKKSTLFVDGALGKQHIYPALIACAGGIASGLTLAQCVKALETHETPPGRMKILEGVKDSVLLDDCYNSSPIALVEALRVLKNLKKAETGRKIAILGDMRELGTYSKAEHEYMGEVVSKCADIIVLVGVETLHAYEVALTLVGEEKVKHFDDSVSAGEYLVSIVGAEDILLVKGSQGIRMERISKMLLAPHLKPASVLVRQEEEWNER
jgi:UDP-N-acetylmuramoyl-tripeptide--D-alanyl-D-alanine ligase